MEELPLYDQEELETMTLGEIVSLLSSSGLPPRHFNYWLDQLLENPAGPSMEEAFIELYDRGRSHKDGLNELKRIKASMDYWHDEVKRY